MSIMGTVTDKTVEFIREALALITGGLDPDSAVEAAKQRVGVTDEELSQADTGDLLQALCLTPDAPLWSDYFTAVQQSYNGNGNVVVQGNSTHNSSGSSSVGSGGSGGSSGGSSHGSSTAASPAEQIVYNYNSYEQTINDQDNLFQGVFTGDLSIDQSQTDIDGDGNQVTHGGGQAQNVSGEGNSGAQSGFGDANSTSGDNSPLIDGDANGAGFNFGAGNQQVASGNTVGGDGQAGAFGGGATNVSHNDASHGGAVSGVGDATGHSHDSHDSSYVDQDVAIKVDRDNRHDDNDTVIVDHHGGGGGHGDGGHHGGHDGGNDGGHDDDGQGGGHHSNDHHGSDHHSDTGHHGGGHQPGHDSGDPGSVPHDPPTIG